MTDERERAGATAMNAEERAAVRGEAGARGRAAFPHPAGTT